MKPYQHHEEPGDIGKAEPKPKRPTSRTPRKAAWNTYRRPKNSPCCIHGHGK